VIGRGDYHWQHEPAWYAVRKGKTGHWSGDRTQTTVWPIPHLRSETGHGTQKPVACMQRPIENNSCPGQAVYDPFCGSGTTIIAAEITSRSCHAVELSPAYCDVAIERWQALTGAEATLEAGGESFAAIAAERGSAAPDELGTDSPEGGRGMIRWFRYVGFGDLPWRLAPGLGACCRSRAPRTAAGPCFASGRAPVTRPDGPPPPPSRPRPSPAFST
jgi:hypothetical protein